MSKNFLESLYGIQLDDLPEDVFESKLAALFEAAAHEEDYQMLSNKVPLQKILGEIGISGEIEEKVGCCCVTLPDEDAFHQANKMLADADVIYKLAKGGWVAAKQGDVAMTNEPAEYKISFLDIAEIKGGDSDKVPDLNKVAGDAQKADDAHEQEHSDTLSPVEHGTDKTGGKTTGVGKASDGNGPEGKIKDSASNIVNNLLECDPTDGKSPGVARKPAAKGVPGRPKGLPKDLKKGTKLPESDEGGFETWWENNQHSESLRDDYENACKDMREMKDGKPSFKAWARKRYKTDESELPEPPLNEMTSTGSMGTVPSPVGAKEMYEPGRGLETKGSGGKKLGRKFKMPGQWNQQPPIAPKRKK